MTKPATLKNIEKSDRLFDEALALEAEGKYDAALAKIERVLKLDPAFAEAHNLVGDILVKRCDFDAALVAFRKACALKPDVELYLYDLACALAWTDRYAEARDAFRRCLDLDPGHAEVYVRLGGACFELGEHAAALDLLRRGILNDPGDIVARYYLGRTLLALGRKDEAEREFGRVIEKFKSFLLVNPGAQEGFYFIGVTARHLGRLEEAATNLKRSIELDTPEIDYHAGFGLTYHDYDAHYQYAAVLKELGRRDEARTQAKRAHEIRPDRPEASRLLEELGH